MKLGDIYDMAVRMGIEADPRDRVEIDRKLDQSKKSLDKLDDAEKPFFDRERLTNPFDDTRIMAGDREREVGELVAGIDMETQEVLLADRLNQQGRKIDLILTHHPEGPALAALHGVMSLQADVWAHQGVPVNVGDALISERASEVKRRMMPVNHMRAVDASELMGLAYMSCHTPADNLVNRFVATHLEAAEPRTLDEVVKALREIEEYRHAATQGCGPEIIAGSPDRRAGRISVDMTGGTEGPVEAFERLADAGVGTIVGMHFSEDIRKKADEKKMNLVVAGHIASDSIGMNHVLDEIESRGVKVTACSGLYRVKRS
jgi:hypothetical protein